jgi:hypothetical protein
MFNKRLSYLCITSFLIFLNACGGGEEKSPEDNQGAHNPPLIEQKPKKNLKNLLFLNP